MATFEKIEKEASEFAAARKTLVERIATFEDEVAVIKKRKMPGIKTAIEDVALKLDALHTSIENSPELFEKPRTQVVAGIKLGFQKGRGGMEIEDEERTIKLIRRHLADQADDLIKVEETPIKSALADLDAKMLKKIGVTVEETGDVVVIKPADGLAKKIINAMLKEASKLEEGANIAQAVGV